MTNDGTVFRFLLCIGLIVGILASGCEDAEERARYVKAPLVTGDLTTRATLNDAVNEARTRLLSVRDPQLRAGLSKEIEQVYERALVSVQDAEQQRAASNVLHEGAAVAAPEAEQQRQPVHAPAAERAQAAAGRKARVKHESTTERRSAAVAEFRERTKEAVAGLQVGMRNSALGDGTKVLILRNPTPNPASFDLRCYTRNDAAQRTFSIIIPPGGEKHVGFLQGWCGNFKHGERCEAYVDGERIWKYDVPSD
jgi:hypothetical protein